MTLSKTVTGVLSGLLGCAAGVTYEKKKLSANVVRAAAPVVTDHSPSSAAESSLIRYADAKTAAGPAGDSLLMWNKSQRVSQIMQHGYPSLDTIRTYDNFVLSYDRRNRTANWVLEHLSPELLSASEKSSSSAPSSISRSSSTFFEDESLHPFFRSSNEDYRFSSYDRGHLAAAGNHKLSQSILDQTFVLSNISPQVGRGFNRDVWNDLEQYVRYRAKKSKNLWVCTGPLYLPRNEPDGRAYVRYQVIGKSQVAVPTHFFKALLVENTDGTIDLESYVMANSALDSNIPLRAYQVPLDSIERSAGFLLFHEVPHNLFQRVNGNNPILEKFQNSLAEDRRKRIAARKG